jgi:hypothetical protein
MTEIRDTATLHHAGQILLMFGELLLGANGTRERGSEHIECEQRTVSLGQLIRW